ncbi:phosphatase [Mesobacillus maritimus]|uniref:phosphatase n=1 Tax=Mesobacillus maritimus TaxID=1643336 RepID=UPI00203C5435|nr:phosphatase [Mesobacillus maritimus]MCM3671336.1 phosphatase [Mesobacillus maritimus]
MKHPIIGLTLLIASVIIYGASLIAASIYSQVLAQVVGEWDSRYGIFGTALREVGSVPLTIAILLGLLGGFLIVKSFRKS